MTVIRRDGLTWVAGRDGEAHARPDAGQHRTLCDRLPLPDRYAWPATAFCPTCTAAAWERKGAATVKAS